MNIAIYARQSLDKKDSISVETQIDQCKRVIKQDELKDVEIYTDKGYSGKNTDRPQFQKMMNKVQNGEIRKIVVYKVDRISRSLSDFIQMEAEFHKHHVSFVSVWEQFDTSTPQGKMMLHLIVIFAEMERQQIQQRLKDNYYARGEKGFYLGGYPPFGYEKVPARINGKNTYILKEEPKESKILLSLYSNFLKGMSLNRLAADLNQKNIRTKRGKTWNGSSISRMLRNPVYVKADAEVYSYLESLGAEINNPVIDFRGENGCLVYGNKTERKGTKFKTLHTDYVTLGHHKGIVAPNIWLLTQEKLSRRTSHTSIGQGASSWLQGLVECESCGSKLYVKTAPNKKNPNQPYRYFYCRGRKQGFCKTEKRLVSVATLEKEIKTVLFHRLHTLPSITACVLKTEFKLENEIKQQIKIIDDKIHRLTRAVENGEEESLYVIHKQIQKRIREKKSLLRKLMELQTQSSHKNHGFDPKQLENNWGSFVQDAQKTIATVLIEKVIVNGNRVIVLLK